MAFSSTNLASTGSQARRGKAPMGWTYWTTDVLATVRASGYFDNGQTTITDMRTIMKIGDIIDVVVVDSVTTPTAVTDVGRIVVVSNASGAIDTSDPFGGPTSDIILTCTITDISSAGQNYIVSPVAGAVKAVYSVINGAVTVADAVLTVKTAAGTVGTITIANVGSGAGVVDSLTSGLENTAVAAGATVEVETDGGSTDACVATITVVITPSLADTD